uniref:ATP synthase complex subunit 8 n=1 Tax=Closteromerus claviger TaxID=904192 RepID=E3VSZ5_CLOCA|nr:ATP synthase F0 subunit 8 [Closteromerus claviger]
MPQMAPLNWLTLFLYFSFIFILFNSMNFFTFLYTTKKKETFIKSIKFNWKW